MTDSHNRRPSNPTERTDRVLSRRGLLQGAAGAAVAAAGLARALPAAEADKPAKLKGRIHQSVCQWCFDSIGLEKLAFESAKMGVKSIELVEPKDWPILKKHNLICALSNSHGFLKGLNRKENHAECLAKLRESIDLTAAAGFPSVITFSGLREGMPDDVGLENTVLGLK
jgi:hydroxypyruvate isomerase